MLPAPRDRHGDWNPGRLDDFPKVTQQGGEAEEPGTEAAPDADYLTVPRPPLAASLWLNKVWIKARLFFSNLEARIYKWLWPQPL